MSTIVLEAIARLSAEDSERVVDPPTGELGYGTDMSSAPGARLDASVSGIEALAESIWRELETPHGGLVDDPGYGEDVRRMLNTGVPRDRVASLESRIHAQIARDDRIGLLRVQATPSLDGLSLRIALRVTPADPAARPFAMILAASSAEILLEDVRPL